MKGEAKENDEKEVDEGCCDGIEDTTLAARSGHRRPEERHNTHEIWGHEPADGTSCTHERRCPHHLQFPLTHFQDSVPERIFPRVQFQNLECAEAIRKLVFIVLSVEYSHQIECQNEQQ